MKRTYFRKIRAIVLVLSIGILGHLQSSCERDDICAPETPTTPFLIIKFLNNDARTEIKAPEDLSVRAIGTDIDTNFSLAETTRDSIAIPLRTQDTSTQYELTINSSSTADTQTPNTDVLTIQYTTQEIFVSSACGFKTNYNNVAQTLDIESEDEGNWIKGVSVQRANITDETAAHLFIFH